MNSRRLVLITIVVVLVIIFAQAVPASVGATVAYAESSCQAILTRALDTVEKACGNVGRNKACYGNFQVQLEPNVERFIKFDTSGDLASIEDINKLTTAPLNIEEGVWGISLLKLQANLPDTLPGQNITFLVFGNTSIENTSGNMSAFYFSSGLGNPQCQQAPADGIVVRSPNHAIVTFTVNGVQISIASTVVLQAQPNKALKVDLVEGQAQIQTASGVQILKPGQEVSVPMGGANGLNAVGSPSKPYIPRADQGVARLLKVVDKLQDPKPDKDAQDELDRSQKAEKASWQKTQQDWEKTQKALAPSSTRVPQGKAGSQGQGGGKSNGKGGEQNNNAGGNGGGGGKSK